MSETLTKPMPPIKKTSNRPEDYQAFLEAKAHVGADHGFDPVFMPDTLFPFQQSIVEWAIRKGRAAIFADCGLGKTAMYLAWAENMARKTGKRVLILTPMAVAFQTEQEGRKFGIEVTHRRDGLQSGDRIVVTNYERLHHFDRNDFAAVVCDESSILKNFDGSTRKGVTDFMRKMPYRLLCTATAAPNDYIELGTSSEALGYMGGQDMLNKFFKREKVFVKRDNAGGQGWEMRPHAADDFWRWVCSWSRAIRKPSDMGFDDGDFILPPLEVRRHVVSSSRPRDGYLFDLPAVGLHEQRSDLRNTIDERCGMAADIINAHDKPSIAWCNLNGEGDRLAKAIRGAVQVSGSDDAEHKEEAFAAFIRGDIRVMVTKPKIGGLGLNLQHCAHQTYFPSHSYEQYYQGIRRCWRFGQKNPVIVDMITTDGQEGVLRNLERKERQAGIMFERMVASMWNVLKIERVNNLVKKEDIPSWLFHKN